MTRSTTNALKSFAAATMLATVALVPTVASAQEAITLEIIGVVRMAQPCEIEAPDSKSQPTTPASIDDARIERHADNR